MQRWNLPAEGTTPGDLRYEEVPAPDPGPGQVRIKVGALSINARDSMVLSVPGFGRSPGEDIVPLSDAAGTVDALGGGVTGLAVGDAVTVAHVPTWVDGRPPLFAQGAGSTGDPGFAAEQIVVDAGRVVPAPPHLSIAEASTLQVAGVTAWNCLFGAKPISAGDTVVVLGSGGVSLFAAQVAVALGARVFAAVRSNAEDPRWSELGVSGVITTGEGWGRRMADLTGGGATKVVNTVGPGLTPECIDALAPGGEVAIAGLMDMAMPALDSGALVGRQISVRGVAVGSVAMHRALSNFVAEHGIHPVVHTRVPFAEVPRAYEALAERGVFGKVLIDLP